MSWDRIWNKLGKPPKPEEQAFHENVVTTARDTHGDLTSSAVHLKECRGKVRTVTGI